MPSVVHRRKIGSLTYASGGRQTLEIDRAGVLTRLWLRARFTITNGNSAAVGPLYQTLARILRRIEVIAGGRDTVLSITGESLAARVSYEKGIVAYGMDASVILTATTATTYDIVLPLEFFLPNARRPDDCALDLRRVNQATLALTFANSDCSDIYTTPNSAAISAVTIDVEGEYLLDAPADAVFLVRSLDQISQDLASSNANFAIQVDRQSGLFIRTLTLETLAANIGNGSIISSTGQGLSLEAGSFVFNKQAGAIIQATNRHNFRLAVVTGFYLMDETFFGQGTTMINTGGLDADLRLIADATKQSGTNTLVVTRESVRPLKVV